MTRNRKSVIKIFIFSILVVTVNKIYSQVPANFYLNGCATITQYDPIEVHDKGYQLVFEDDFNGTSLNTADWYTAYPYAPGYSQLNTTTGTGYEKQYYLDENVTVSGGYLYLTTKIDPAVRPIYNTAVPQVPLTFDAFFKYTSGMIYSKASYKAGKFEVRCKLPFIDGVWPAFWLYGGCAQELDCFELFNIDNFSNPFTDSKRLVQTWHREAICGDDDTHCYRSVVYETEAHLWEEFHTYAIDWDETKIIWTVDGNVFRQVYKYWGWNTSSIWPLTTQEEIASAILPIEFKPFPSEGTEMAIILNTAVGATNRGTFPKEFVIDYVRVYAKSDCYTDRVVCENSGIAPGIIAGKTITTDASCNFTISGSSQPIEMKATEEITLKPGFSSELNSDFYAHLTDCEDYEVRSQNANSNNSESNGYNNNQLTNESIANIGQLQSIKPETINNFLELRIFPNPSNGEFSISPSTREAEISEIVLQNILGKPIPFSQTKTTDEIRINISNQPKGVYLLKITCKGKVFMKKIIFN